MDCRPGCGACCIAISISSPLPGMPNGKPPGVRCVNLSDTNECRIHNSPDYPEVCRNFTAVPEICGETFEEAFANISELERLTAPE